MLSDEYINEYKYNNRSGKMSSQKYVSNHFPKDYELILEYCEYNNLHFDNFKEMVYCTINNIEEIVKCNNPNCSNKVKFKNSTIGYIRYCSNVCVGSDDNVKRKREDTNLNRFGVKHASLNEEIRNKVKENYDNRTEIYKSIINKKRVDSVISKYGVDNVSKVDYIKEKRVNKFKINIDKWKDKYRKTSLDRYGVIHPWMNSDIHNKSVLSSYNKKKELYISKVLDKLPKNYILVEVIKRDGFSRLVSKINCPNCNMVFEINNSLLYDRTIRNKTEICTLCNPVDVSVSGLEIQLFNFISDNYSGEVIRNDRDIISPYEIDIYIPEFNLALEFNGLYWHSELNKEVDYHCNKTKMCSEIGINLIHIWEDDWVYKGDIIKSMILNKLNRSKNKIYARSCVVSEISDNKLIREFLDDNHIQGFVGSKVKLGLFFEDKLVSLMTFGKFRMSNLKNINKDDYELIRFCNILNTNVLGSASKLLNYFIKNNRINNIISYSDNSYSDGKLYNTLGFKLESIGKLNYYWVIDNKRCHRYNFRKSNLIKFGYDVNKSEREIMYEDIGSYRIWGSGNKKWIMHINLQK